MQTILGAGGAIGTALATALRNHTDAVRLVSRNPHPVHPEDECVAADLTDAEAVLGAVAGSEVVYLTAGLSYDAALWERTWPVIMDNVIAACNAHTARLVFFDNIYMYDPDALDGMDETTPFRPVSRKGRVRAALVEKIAGAQKAGNLTALIARCADFYGPSIDSTSILTETVFKPLAAGKKASWLMSGDYRHSFTWVPDAATATALLGNTPDAFGEVWHLPTAPAPPTGREWVAAIAAELGVAPRMQVAPRFLVRLMGLFNPVMRNLVEMLYQYDRHYVFDSGKFERRFGIPPTPYAEGIREVVARDFRPVT